MKQKEQLSESIAQKDTHYLKSQDLLKGQYHQLSELYMDTKWQPRKLSMHQAAQIRECYDNGATQNWIATKFGVCKATIKSIVQGKTYREGS